MESGIFWVSNDLADRSSLSHFSIVANSVSVRALVVVFPSESVTLTGTSDGREPVPSKWPQNPFASIASWKRTKKMAQLRPLASSLGMEEGNESDNDVVVTDMIRKFSIRVFFLDLSAMGGAHNLLEIN